MGLKVNIEHVTGAIITYVNIGSITIDKAAKNIGVSLCGYLSKELRDAGKTPQCIDNMTFSNYKLRERKIEPELDAEGKEIKDEAGNVVTTSKDVTVDYNNYDKIYADIATAGLEAALYNHLKTLPDFQSAENA